MSYKYRIVKAMGNPITVIVKIENQTTVVTKGQKNFDLLVAAIKAGARQEVVENLLDSKKAILEFLQKGSDHRDLLAGTEFEGEFLVSYDEDTRRILLNGIPMENKLTRLIMRYVENNDMDKVKPLAMFLGRVMLNPVAQSRRDLFEFLQHNNYELAEDGRFYAFKSVSSADEKSHSSGREDVYVDGAVHKGRIPNPDGAIISMARSEVDDNSGNACSHGLHIGSLSYASGFHRGSSKLKVVLVDPEHVVSVPVNESADKMRTCQYEVVGEYEEGRKYGLALL